MEVTAELITAIAKDGILGIAVIYLWKRVTDLTDAYINSIKEQAKVISDNTNSNNTVARSLDQLTSAVNSSDKRL